MIEYFDTYVRTDRGFIAVKDDLVAHCWKRGSYDDSFVASVYRDRQKSKRPIAHASGGTVAWCREAIIGSMKRIKEKEQRT